MELPLKIIIIVAILALVLVLLSTYFLRSSTESISRSEAERIFNSDCITYAQRDCTWEVTREPEFENYLKACRVLYGPYREAYSCLYSLCNGCFESSDLRCSGLCKICSGHDYASVERESCCLRYKGECSSSSVDCTAACGTLI